MQTVALWVGGITGIIGLAALLWRVAFKPLIWRLFVEPLRRLDSLWRDWAGEPARDGVPARLSVMAHLAEHDNALREHGEILRDVRAQLYPNHGSSMRDAIDGLRADLQAAGVIAAQQRGRVYRSGGRHRADEHEHVT